MKSDILILHDGMNALKNSLGLVETEKFISIILREKFDYTEWQKNLLNDLSIHEINENATKYYNSIDNEHK